MRFDQVAESTFRVLDKCTDDLRQENPWHWISNVRNGAVLQMESRLVEGFLQLASCSESTLRSVAELELALLGNSALPGGIGLALGPASRGLHMRADIALPLETTLDEERLRHRLKWTLGGFHDGVELINSLGLYAGPISPPADAASDGGLAELVRACTWKCEERGPNDFVAVLDSETEPAARIRATEHGVLLSVELGRVESSAAASRAGLAVFMLTAGGLLRMARPYALETETGWGFGFRVCLRGNPEPQEIDHGLAALSIAHQSTAREARALLDEPTARCYLAARAIPTTN